MKPVIDIINDYLGKHGYDGLYEPGECACEKGDLGPCCSSCLSCMPGYKNYCKDCPEYDDCSVAGDLSMGRENGWCIGPDKKTRKKK